MHRSAAVQQPSWQAPAGRTGRRLPDQAYTSWIEGQQTWIGGQKATRTGGQAPRKSVLLGTTSYTQTCAPQHHTHFPQPCCPASCIAHCARLPRPAGMQPVRLTHAGTRSGTAKATQEWLYQPCSLPITGHSKRSCCPPAISLPRRRKRAHRAGLHRRRKKMERRARRKGGVGVQLVGGAHFSAGHQLYIGASAGNQLYLAACLKYSC